VVAWALRDAARHDPVARAHLRRAGPGFRGMTRLAGSPRPLWRQIFSANVVELTRALAAFSRRLEGEKRRFRE
jgi:prephenate dehydrogenase